MAVSNKEKLQEIEKENAEDGAEGDCHNPGYDNFFEHLKIESF